MERELQWRSSCPSPFDRQPSGNRAKGRFHGAVPAGNVPSGGDFFCGGTIRGGRPSSYRHGRFDALVKELSVGGLRLITT